MQSEELLALRREYALIAYCGRCHARLEFEKCEVCNGETTLESEEPCPGCTFDGGWPYCPKCREQYEGMEQVGGSKHDVVVEL